MKLLALLLAIFVIGLLNQHQFALGIHDIHVNVSVGVNVNVGVERPAGNRPPRIRPTRRALWRTGASNDNPEADSAGS
ncbi:maker756 [Drosophila busckii]|uniref:Maker756 n=1 Tax=Drosophila busckii TaxID=30019 RepID=A0A0M5J682_DROBS|nr:maker756 [Drosophila busckii]